MKKFLVILSLLVSDLSWGANYQVEFLPADNSISDAKVQSISSSKISDFSQAVQAELPAGMIMAFSGSSCPSGWLEADGSAVSRSGKGRLFSAIGITHGQGDGSTTFNLPDYRGRFLRGVDKTAGRDADKASRTASAPGGNSGNLVGSVQGDEFKSHSHNYTAQDFVATASPSSGVGGLTRGGAVPNQINIVGNRNAMNDGLGAIWNSGGSETRPKNVYVLYCVKE